MSRHKLTKNMIDTTSQYDPFTIMCIKTSIKRYRVLIVIEVVSTLWKFYLGYLIPLVNQVNTVVSGLSMTQHTMRRFQHMTKKALNTMTLMNFNLPCTLFIIYFLSCFW